MKTIYISILFVLASTCLSAQKAYDLARCKELAIENNRSIKNSIFTIDASKQVEKEAFTTYFPTLSASGMGFNAKNPVLAMDMGGTSLGLLEDGFAGAVNITQPIFVGGKIIFGNKLSKLGVEISKQGYRVSENEVLLSVENSFWQLLGLHEKINTLDVLNQQLVSLLKDVEVAYKAGLITNNDVLQVKLKLNGVKSSKANLENGISLLKMSLCQLLGLDIDFSDQFDIDRPDINNPQSPMTYYVNHREALTNRAENIILDKSMDISKLQTKIKRADYLPTVAVGASYYQNNIITDKWKGNSAVFVTVSVPLSGWWGGSHAIKQQRINEYIAENNKLDGQEHLLLQMQSVKNDMDNAYKQILIAKESVEQSDENLRLNNNYYSAGMIALSDLFDAQTLMQQSRDNYVDSYSDYQRRQYQYLQVTGR